MIAVIADDFTGAAEIGGLGLRYGLKVKIETSVVENQDIDLMIIATDTRSMQPNDAAETVASITNDLISISPDFIFKKTDSVMRGHILEELKAFMTSANEKSLVLVSANPSLGRTIVDQKYYINNIPLHKTGFANDPEFPTNTSDVVDLLGESEKIKISVQKATDLKVSNGIVIAESKDECELDRWTSRLQSKFLYAGAAGHFISILEQLGHKNQSRKNVKVDLKGRKCVYVCGSAIDTSRNMIEMVKKKGSFVSEIPEELIYQKGDQEKHKNEWIKDIKNILRKESKVIIAINKPLIKEFDIANRLRKYIADAVYEIYKNEKINELIVEGGATAYSIIQRCNFNEFYPAVEMAHGVLRMKIHGIDDFNLTLKPGSYTWPKEIWNF